MNNGNYLGRAANMNPAGATEETREIAEIQAKMILARNFPRDVDRCMQRIAYECENKELAETATYEYPRGDTVVRGASIRLVECVARHWGNIVSGIKEIGTHGNKATVKAFCWDLESNFADEKVFDVEYIRNTKKGSYEITDARDRYELMANYAARRKRACMQAIIPQSVIDAAIDLCQKTLEDSVSKDGIEAVRAKMLEAFIKLDDRITPDNLAETCGKEFDKLGRKDIVKLRNLFNAIKDGFVKPETVFGWDSNPAKPSVEEAAALDKLNAAVTAQVTSDGTDKG